MASVICDVAQ